MASDLYAPEGHFQDPFATVRGADAIGEYLTNAYLNVIDCRFDFGPPVIDGVRMCQPWIMQVRHRRLKGGQPLRVDGNSVLQWDGELLVFHRDYFDAGQLLYENVPVLGSAVRWLRRHAG